MADAIISAVSERIIAIVEEQIRGEVNLLRGVEEELQSLGNELNRIRSVLNNAESRRFKEKDINDWLVRHEDTAHEIDDVLGVWNYDNLKLQMEKSNAAVASMFLSKKMKSVKGKLDRILEEKER